MARRMDELDWEATSLGPPDSWPQSLRTAVRILLTSRFAMWMGWGPDLAFLYNDSYKRTLGVKHPAALGWPARQVWAEIWHDIGPRIQTVMKTGTATWDEGLLLVLERSGYPEETYHTFSYSPLTEDDGTVSGMLCVVTEETERVIGERHLASLQELSSSLATTTTELDALAAIERVLARHSKELPFTLTYLFKNAGSRARLAARTGIPLDHPAAPLLIELGANHPVWPGDALLQGNAPILVNNLAARFDDLPRGVWEKPPRQALLVPVAQQGQIQPAGFLVAGLNPFRRLDEAYSGFIQLIAGQVAASLANARAVSERTGELEETTQRLRISERMAALGTLAAGLGHDMGNLLLPMDVRLGLLIEADLPRELHEHVVGIQKCARYLQRLSSGLRLLATDPAHVESRGATDLGRWWNDVRIILKDVLPGGIRFEHHLPQSESWVALGRTGLTQAVFNLVQNAADALKEHGGSRVSVSVENDPSVPWITMLVADDGPGMTEEVARRCMEPYFSTKARGESTGMGMALVHALVTGAGGQVEIRSAPGQGTTISLILPRALPKEQTQDASPDMAGAV